MLSLDFENKVVVITGSSGGLGQATVEAFSSSRARVVCVDLVRPEKLPQNAHFVKVDVTNFEQVGECVGMILQEDSKIDCLVNNAGISRDAAVWKRTESRWDAVLDVNLKGAFNWIHHVAPHFRERSQGKIVNVSSINGLRGKFGLANYAASKAGLIGLTKTVAKELGRSQVNVNAIAPGYVLTPLTEQLPQEVIEQAREETVFGRLGKPEDVANLVLFLCSDLAQHITGEVIKVDGGQYI